MLEGIEQNIRSVQKDIKFSGTVYVSDEHKTLVELSLGYASRSEELLNNTLTRYGIASGCKIFTSVAICQLVECGKLTFDTKVKDIAGLGLANLDGQITVHHLLTHTSGMPDYYDEEEMDNFEDLWRKIPMYHMRSLTDFLPLFEKKPMKFEVGTRFHYNNAGYIVLGLIVEAVTKRSFTEYVQEHIFDRAGMGRSGYYELDALPPNTALGYIDLPGGAWKTNIYSLPVKGGADGGAFVTVIDMVNFWEALMKHELLSPSVTQQMLTAHTKVDDEGNYYGYGVWIAKNPEDQITKYHVMGYDPGVNFRSSYYPCQSITAVICSNQAHGAYDVMKCVEDSVVWSGNER